VVGSATTATGASNFFSRTSDLVKKDAEATLPQDGYTPSALDQKEFRGVLSQFGSGEVISISRTPEADQPLLFWDGKVLPPRS
jgi:hypothetical protein